MTHVRIENDVEEMVRASAKREMRSFQSEINHRLRLSHAVEGVESYTGSFGKVKVKRNRSLFTPTNRR